MPTRAVKPSHSLERLKRWGVGGLLVKIPEGDLLINRTAVPPARS